MKIKAEMHPKNQGTQKMASRASEAGGEAQNRFSLTAQNSKTFVGLVSGYSRNKIRSKQFT